MMVRPCSRLVLVNLQMPLGVGELSTTARTFPYDELGGRDDGPTEERLPVSRVSAPFLIPGSVSVAEYA